MTPSIGSPRSTERSTRLESSIVLPNRFVDSTNDDLLRRGMMWGAILEAAICIAVGVGWKLWA